MPACSPISAFGGTTLRPSSTSGCAATTLTPKALRWRSAHYRQLSFSVIADCRRSGLNPEHLPRGRASSRPRPAVVPMHAGMVSIHIDLEKLDWRPGSAQYVPVALHAGTEIIHSPNP